MNFDTNFTEIDRKTAEIAEFAGFAVTNRGGQQDNQLDNVAFVGAQPQFRQLHDGPHRNWVHPAALFPERSEKRTTAYGSTQVIPHFTRRNVILGALEKIAVDWKTLLGWSVKHAAPASQLGQSTWEFGGVTHLTP